MMLTARDRIIAAIDVDNYEEAHILFQELGPHVGMFKAGLELTTAVGPQVLVHLLRDEGIEVFLDAKYHDIPTTVGRAAAVAGKIGASAFNVHASAGIEAMMMAVANKGMAKAWAVTVLTSLDEASCEHVYGASTQAKVLQLARDAMLAKMDGVICSPLELRLLRKQPELAKLALITPGIRPEWASTNDQKRFMTPGEAIRAGATYLVIGRPLTNPPAGMTRKEAVGLIIKEVEDALSIQ